MQFSKQTIDTLKSFAQINPSIWFEPGSNVKTVNELKTIYSYATLEDNIDAAFGIYDLHGFLDLLSMLGPDATLTYDKDQETIFLQNQYSKINFRTATKSSINGGDDVPNLRLPDPVLSIKLEADAMSQIMKIARKTGVNVLAIESEDGMIKINGYQVAEIKRNMSDPKMFSFNISKYDGDRTFKFLLNMGNVIIPNADYMVDIHVLGVNLMANFKTDDSNFAIALEVTSEHDFED